MLQWPRGGRVIATGLFIALFVVVLVGSGALGRPAVAEAFASVARGGTGAGVVVAGGWTAPSSPASGVDGDTTDLDTSSTLSGRADSPRLIPVAVGSTASPALSPSAISPWAVAVSHGSSWAPNAWVQQVADAGVTVVRGFADDPTMIAAQTDAGLTLTGFLQWGPAGKPLAFPAADLPGWRAYVSRMVTKHPEVDHWEVWNEPPNFSTDTDPAHYAQIVVAAYDTVKSIDPEVQVGLAAKSTDIRWLAEAITAGAAGHFDYITLHPYERIDLLLHGNEASYLGIAPTVRAMLADVAPDQVDVPIRFTETGIPTSVAGRTFTTRTVSAQVQAETLVKVYAMGIAQGVESIAWFDPYDGDYQADGPSEPPYGLIAKDGTPRPAYSALSSLITNLGSRPTYAGMLTPDDETFELVFVDGTDTVLVAWSRTGESLTFSGDVAVTNPAAGSADSSRVVALDASPVLIRLSGVEAAQWVDEAQSGEPGESIAEQLGAQTGVARLSAQDGDLGLALAQSREPQIVDGRLAYTMSGTPSVKFVVDPAFSAWDRTPVTVTAVVHRLGGGPGFNLKYDADAATTSLDWAGQRNTGAWRSVPGSGWATVTWNLDDASFVGKYGFGLRLDSDSAAYSDYALASLTITER